MDTPMLKTSDPSISFVTQMLLTLALLIVTSAAGFVPLMIVKLAQNQGQDPRKRGWMSYLSCFSGGVFMASCFLGVLPHINKEYAKLNMDYDLKIAFPVPQLIVCCGFFLIYLLEEIIRMIFSDSSPEDRGAYEKACEQNPLDLEAVERKEMLRALIFAFAISFHSLLEGFALGVQDTSSGLFSLFISLLIHKSVEAFSVGIQFSKAGTSKIAVIVATVLTYAFMTPLGALIGALIQREDRNLGRDGVMFTFESLAAGTFIYVTFVEIVAYEKANHFNNFKQLSSIITGFLIITVLTYFFEEP
ncbi:unnamed protein product [Caenorhabditis auriculariae]|uniref:Zinc transporter ZIP3 n=1 Tax=Caenorhabditis auriculariae TaxID=2777116 RepID=A0A8S1GVH8_9PELO|nr:unnamed protein product [Caenorhabditis auriculariae]